MEPTRTHEQQQIALRQITHAQRANNYAGLGVEHLPLARSQEGRDGQGDAGHRGREAHGR
jgi:hypothetical protein